MCFNPLCIYPLCSRQPLAVDAMYCCTAVMLVAANMHYCQNSIICWAHRHWINTLAPVERCLGGVPQFLCVSVCVLTGVGSFKVSWGLQSNTKPVISTPGFVCNASWICMWVPISVFQYYYYHLCCFPFSFLLLHPFIPRFCFPALHSNLCRHGDV